MSRYREFVAANERWYRGRRPETEQSLDAAEVKLGIRLPSDLRWLLSEYGYWHATGISSLKEAVDWTLRAREHLNLPSNMLVLYDRGDAGTFILDWEPDPETGEHRVWGVAWEDVPDDLDAGTRFASLQEYGQYLIEKEGAFLAEDDVDYDPRNFPEGKPPNSPA